MKKVILFSVGLMSLAAPIVSRAAESEQTSPREFNVYVREQIKDAKGHLSSRSILSSDGKKDASYKEKIDPKDENFKFIPKTLPGYKLLDGETAIKGSIKNGFTVTYVSDNHPEKLFQQVTSNDTSSNKTDFDRITENKKINSDNHSDVKTGEIVGNFKQSDLSNLNEQNAKKRPKNKTASDEQVNSGRKDDEDVTTQQVVKEEQSIGTPKEAEPSSTMNNLAGSNLSDDLKGQKPTDRHLVEKDFSKGSKQLLVDQSINSKKSTQLAKSKGLSSDTFGINEGQVQHEVNKISADKGTSHPTQSRFAKKVSREQNKMGLKSSHMIKVQGLDETGNDLFLKVIDRSKVADIFHENIEFYGYEWQSTTYDKQKDLYLLQYQRNDVKVTIVNVDENGHQLSKSTLSGKFGEKLHYVPISIDGYRSIITDKQITLSTMTPANVKINYVKDNDKKMDLQVNHSELPVTNKERSLENTPKDVFEDTKNQNVVLNDQGVSKEVNDKAEDKKQNNQVTQKTGRSTRGRSKNKHVVLSKKATDPKSSAQQVSESSNSETTRSSKAGRSSNRLPQTGDADSKRGIIIGLGLLISLLVPKLKKWI
nr:MucBP domain-containing protein [Lentilactobacillus hilgardii]